MSNKIKTIEMETYNNKDGKYIINYLENNIKHQNMI